MSTNEVEVIMAKFGGITKALWGLVVVGFGVGVWATTLQLEVGNLKTGRAAIEKRIDRIEFYVIKIAEKVGVDVEAPR